MDGSNHQGYADIDLYAGLFDRMRPDYRVLAELLEALAPRQVVEIGCGSGRLLPLYLASAAEEIVGIDAEPGMVAAFERCGDRRIRGRLGDARDGFRDAAPSALLLMVRAVQFCGRG